MVRQALSDALPEQFLRLRPWDKALCDHMFNQQNIFKGA